MGNIYSYFCLPPHGRLADEHTSHLSRWWASRLGSLARWGALHRRWLVVGWEAWARMVVWHA